MSVQFVFLGNMNSMPMMYARELKARGESVLFIVDSKKSNHLSRPEAAFSDIRYPYPEWIIEKVVASQFLLALCPRLFASYFRFLAKKHAKHNSFHYVLNGFFTALSPCLVNHGKVTCLSHGSDLHTWACLDELHAFQEVFKTRSFLKFLPTAVSRMLISHAAQNQLKGFEHAQTILYFPRGFSRYGDAVINHLTDLGVRHVPVRGFSSSSLVGRPRKFKINSGKLIIFCGVRFTYKTFPGGKPEHSKGNDLIIKGLAKFCKNNENTEIHFVEKGGDVAHAKELTEELGLSSHIIWHKEMTFIELMKLYEDADICFDQVGSHWIGAIGGYALWYGKPLIANASREVASGVWPKNNPVLQASTVDEICTALNYLSKEENRKRASERSALFFDECLDFRHVVDELFY